MSKVEHIFSGEPTNTARPQDKTRFWRRYSPSFLSDKNNPRLSTSPWSGHRYFAYDLIAAIKPKRIVELGTHYGCSFFAFAQAILDRDLRCELVAVDTWQGDEHAGHYEEDVFQLVCTTIADHFSDLDIRLIRSTFLDAREKIEDNSVDLLHIDGFHSYEAAKEDFETWRPKLAPNAVVLFHDIAPSSGYGSAEYWREIRAEHPHAQFLKHSFGLGILFPNGRKTLDKYLHGFRSLSLNYYMYRAQAELLERQVSDTSEMLEKRFKIIGEMDNSIAERDSIISAQQYDITERDELLRQREDTIRGLEGRISSFQDQLNDASQLLKARYEAMEEMDKAVDERDQLIRKYENRFAVLDENIARREILSDEQSKRALSLQDQLAQASHLLEERFEVMEKMDLAIDERDSLLKSYESKFSEFDQELRKRDDQISESLKQIESLETLMGQKEKLLDERFSALQALRNVLSEREATAREREQQIEALNLDVQAREALIEQLQEQHQSLSDAILEHERARDKYKVDFEAEKNDLNTQIAALESKLDAHAEELDSQNQELQARDSCIDSLYSDLEAAIKDLTISKDDVASLADELDEAKSREVDLAAISENLSSENESLRQELNTSQSIRESEANEHRIRLPYTRLAQVYKVKKKPREVLSNLLASMGAGTIFAEMGVTLYAFTRHLLEDSHNKGVKHLFFFAREGQILMDMFLRLQQAMYPHHEHIKCHYLKVSRRSTFLMSLRPLADEDFHVLFRQYRRISILEFLKSLSLDIFEKEVAELLNLTSDGLKRRSDDLPTDPIFQKLISHLRFQDIYETERTRRRENFRRYLDDFDSDFAERKQICVVDVGWKGSIQDNLYNWMHGQFGTEAIVDGYYLGLIAMGSAHELNTKTGLLLDTSSGNQNGARIFNENRALFEILLPADHGSACDYVRDSSGAVIATDQLYDEEHMIEAHVRPITDNFKDLFYVACDVIAHHQYPLEEVFDDAMYFHRRMVFDANLPERDWFHSISHVENFGVFEESRFRDDVLGKSLLERARFTLRLRRREFREGLGFWPWLKLRSNALPLVAWLYAQRQWRKS